MIIPESFLWTWFVLAALSTAYVAWDNFGAHTYERRDRPRGEFFHTDWLGGGTETPA